MLWIFVRDISLTLHHVTGELLLGGLVGMTIAYTFRHMYTPIINIRRAPRMLPYAAAYLYTFVNELVRGNIAVMRLVLSPHMPIHPAVIKIPLRVQSDAAITLIANSITLTPGTLTLDHDTTANALYIHTIAGQDCEAVVAPIRRWEELAMVLFNEERKRIVRPVQTETVAVPDVKPEAAY
jgi:multicomponent Na+:H+ antiporter subunit E